jgi:molybdenum cofactor cytidylyltransferase
MTESEAQVAGIVLAAGSSTRMGSNKMLLELEGEPLVRRAVRAALAASVGPVLVVVGHEAERVGETVSDLPCEIVLNPEHALGAGSSLRAGVQAVPAEAGAAVVVLGDMPFVTGAMIRGVVERYREGHPRLVVSRYGSVTAPPTLFDRSLFGELLALGGEDGGRQVVRAHQHEAARCVWRDKAVADVDVAEDYARLLEGRSS